MDSLLKQFTELKENQANIMEQQRQILQNFENISHEVKQPQKENVKNDKLHSKTPFYKNAKLLINVNVDFM